MNKLLNGTGYLYISKNDEYYWLASDNYFDDGIFLNDTVEIIEEQEEIDIQSIEEIEPAMNGNAYVIDNKTWTLNQVIKAVRQLDKKIKEK